MEDQTATKDYQNISKMLAWSQFENDAWQMARDDWYPVRGRWTPVYTDPIGTIWATPEAMISATIARDLTNKMSRRWTRPAWALSIEFVHLVKKCPKCAEYVKGEAVICRFCHYEWPETERTPIVAPSRAEIDILRPTAETKDDARRNRNAESNRRTLRFLLIFAVALVVLAIVGVLIRLPTA